jgi:hypothetical protein
MNSLIIVSRHLRGNNASAEANVGQLTMPMPIVELQIRMLGLYQDFSYASFPILDRGQLWQDFYAM